MQLTETDKAILDFEGSWWMNDGSKQDLIFELFGLTPARYYQTLGALIQEPAALGYHPLVVHRLRRVRQERRLQRRGVRPNEEQTRQ